MKVRLFVAFELPAPVRRTIDAWSAEVRPQLPRARWVPIENLHLTLCFLGDTDPDRLPMLAESLDTAFADAPTLAMRLTAVGAFPNGQRARVVWVGIEADVDLVGLHASVTAAARSAVPDFRPESRPFHPHVTLARCAPPWPRTAVTRLDAAGRDLPRLPFRVAEGTLFASELQSQGAVHTRVATFPMRGTS